MGGPLAGCVIALLVLSLAARRWGRRALELARANPDPSVDPLEREGRRVRVVRTGVRLLSNTALLAGVLMIAALVLCALAPGVFAPYGPEERLGILQLVDGVVEGAPFAPNPQYPLGSDPRARDILSLLIYGARNTLAVVAAVTLMRLLIGGFLGIVAGWRRGAPRTPDTLVHIPLGLHTQPAVRLHLRGLREPQARVSGVPPRDGPDRLGRVGEHLERLRPVGQEPALLRGGACPRLHTCAHRTPPSGTRACAASAASRGHGGRSRDAPPGRAWLPRCLHGR